MQTTEKYNYTCKKCGAKGTETYCPFCHSDKHVTKVGRMSDTQKILFTHWLVLLLLYLAVYIISTFVFWEFRNPFSWIINLPTYDPCDRFGILLVIIFYNIVSIVLIKESVKGRL